MPRRCWVSFIFLTAAMTTVSSRHWVLRQQQINVDAFIDVGWPMLLPINRQIRTGRGRVDHAGGAVGCGPRRGRRGSPQDAHIDQGSAQRHPDNRGQQQPQQDRLAKTPLSIVGRDGLRRLHEGITKPTGRTCSSGYRRGYVSPALCLFFLVCLARHDEDVRS